MTAVFTLDAYAMSRKYLDEGMNRDLEIILEQGKERRVYFQNFFYCALVQKYLGTSINYRTLIATFIIIHNTCKNYYKCLWL